jgi:hypothetical protein
VLLVGFDLEFRSVGLSFANDLVTGVGNPAEDRIGNDRIGKESCPDGRRLIGCEDDARGAEAAVDDCVETLGGCLVDRARTFLPGLLRFLCINLDYLTGIFPTSVFCA